MKIIKNSHEFNVSGYYSENWFSNNKLDRWELDTFHILDHYNKRCTENIYIDIGSWIGPTVLYAANIYNKVIAIEPDPVAISRFEENLSVNNFNNIVLVKKGISDKDGKIKFGGNGDFGNSESTILVSNDAYSTWGGTWSKEERTRNIIEIDTITIETLLNEQQIDPLQISLIKMDIEGGELIVTPCLESFLRKYKPAFYISLHYCFLKNQHVYDIVERLFSIYDSCYIFDNNGNKILKSKDEVISSKLNAIVFE